MPIVEFTIGKQRYDLACNPGEEEKIRQLAGILNERFEKISESFGQSSHNFIMAVTALMMEDEIATLKEHSDAALSDSKQPQVPLQAVASQVPSLSDDEIKKQVDAEVAKFLEPIADYAEKLANKFEKS